MSSYTAIQDPRELLRSGRVAMAAELVTIRMTEAVVRLSVAPEEVRFPFQVELKVGSKGVILRPGRFYVQVRFRLRAREAKDHRPPPLELRCAYVANYALPGGEERKRSEIQAFAHGNAVFNCWPYFRELVQNACARLGLPPLTLPLFKVKVGKPKPRVPKRPRKV